jgi:hypothetical protein
MNRLRQRREGRWLALFALALLTFASFGHVHHDWFESALRASCHSIGRDADDCPPANHDHSDCQICSALAHLGSGTAAPPPALPVQTDNRATLSRIASAPAKPDVATSSFDARGPPPLLSA